MEGSKKVLAESSFFMSSIIFAHESHANCCWFTRLHLANIGNQTYAQCTQTSKICFTFLIIPDFGNSNGSNTNRFSLDARAKNVQFCI